MNDIVNKGGTCSLFSKVANLLAKNEKQEQERIKQGNEFNVFGILGVTTDETRLHSAIIAELLDPKGSHGHGALFLEEFLKIINLGVELDANSAIVEVEYVIGNISKDKRNGGRIDILIKDAACRGVIIENKIDACDQPFQLLRYHNYAKQNLTESAIVYLTKDCKEPSEESIGDGDFNYICFSYKDDIIPWLERCLPKINERSQVAITIEQYIKTLRLILNIMDKNLSEEILDIATLPENIEAAIAIMEQADAIKKHIRDEFLQKLVEKLHERGYETEVEDGFSCDKLKTFYIWKPEVSEEWCIVLRSNYKNGSNMFYTIEWCGDGSSPIYQRELSLFTPIFGKVQTRERPMGDEFFYGLSGKRGAGRWYDWNDATTIRAMKDGSLMNFIMKSIIDKIERNDTLRVLSSYKRNKE